MINNDPESIRAAAVLTNGYVAGTVIDLQNASQAQLYVVFTKGSLTSAEIKLEFSPDKVTYYQEVSGSITAGVETDTLQYHTITASGNYRIPVPAADRWLKVSAQGTGTVTNSSMTLDIQLGNA